MAEIEIEIAIARVAFGQHTSGGLVSIRYLGT